jgi:hypothetical protein
LASTSWRAAGAVLVCGCSLVFPRDNVFDPDCDPSHAACLGIDAGTGTEGGNPSDAHVDAEGGTIDAGPQPVLLATLTTAGGTADGWRLAEDANNLYVASAFSGGATDVNQVAKIGGAVTPYASAYARDIAVNSASLFWPAFDTSLVRATKGGGTPSAFYSTDKTAGIAADDANVYTVDVTAGSVLAISVGAGGTTPLATATGASRVAVDSSAVYWSTQSSGLFRVLKVGGAATPIAGQGQGEKVIDFAVAGSAIVSLQEDQTSSFSLLSTPTSGGPQTTLAAISPGPSGSESRIAADTNDTFVCEGGVYRLPAGGAVNEIESANQHECLDIVADPANIFWLEGGGTGEQSARIYRLAR